ncbi:hypothetical protein RRG08_055716 [Elysia crispata]|uniref:Uncharacterized protein n=1 Tax=Elysia crispata TaxID=231223 RepID=A0AAE1AZR6_9GAST|nr:hypothetical protein RRG08_055716 [Elysia crispata]
MLEVAMYCRKANLRFPLKSTFEEYKCRKIRLLCMLEDSEDPIVKTYHKDRSVYDLLPSNANLVVWGKKEEATCPLRQGRLTTGHVLSPCKIALSRGRYIWRHNRVLQEHAVMISTA